MVAESRKRHQMRHLDVLYRLLRDQEVDGSNPFAPTILQAQTSDRKVFSMGSQGLRCLSRSRKEHRFEQLA